MPDILVDTGVWYAFFDARERQKRGADDVAALYELLLPHRWVIPWPVAYETLRTRFVRNAIAVVEFEKALKMRSIVFLDDAPYRQDALDESIASARGHPKLSMVDCVIRRALSDPNSRIDFLATYNADDFSDICRRRRIEIIPDA